MIILNFLMIAMRSLIWITFEIIKAKIRSSHPEVLLRKSENIQQITPMVKCDFNEVGKQLY